MAKEPKLKSVFRVDIDGKDVELAVRRPTPADVRQGTKVYSRTFKDIVTEDGALLRPKLENVLRKQKLWDDQKQAEYEALQKRLLGGERKLAAGGIRLNEGRRVAVDMLQARLSLQDLLADRRALDQHTAEAQAEEARFAYYVCACTVYNDGGKPFFKDAEDYLARGAEPASVKAATELAMLLTDYDPDFESKLPERKFLKAYGFMDDKGRLVDPKTKQLVDADGRHIDDKGYYVNAAGERTDRDGNRLDGEGQYVVDFQAFTDEDDNPIAAPEAQAGV